MSDIVIVALITLIGTVVSGIVGVISANRVINVKIDELAKRVEKHNNVISRTYILETKMENLEEKVHNLEKKN